MYDLIIIGGGPAGMTAAVYAARKILDTLIITENFGGQPIETQEIENYMGYLDISGLELMNRFEEQMKKYQIKDRLALVLGLAKMEDGFIVDTNRGEYHAKALIIASGKHPRVLNIPGEKEFSGKGISYCTTCDGPLYAAQPVAVIGGGNSAVQTAEEMADIASKVYLIARKELTADEMTVAKLKKKDNVEIWSGYDTTEIQGDKFVKSLIIRNAQTEETTELAVKGLFIEIGLIPNSDFAAGFVKLNDKKEIVVDSYGQTNIPGVFAAGDVTDIPKKQIVIAAGEGAKAAMSAYEYLSNLE